MKNCLKIARLFGVGKYSYTQYIIIGRKLVNATGIRRKFLEHTYHKIGVKYGLEIEDFSNIGDDFVLCHPFGITINPKAAIGSHCRIFKGATVGYVRSGKRAGTPVIGDRVTIGCNAFVAGGITIGDDVLIAANSFVDFDVPSDSLVLGNPAVIKQKQNASKDYV